MATKKSSLAKKAPRAAKRAGSRSVKPGIPAHIRADGITIDDDEREFIRQKLQAKLGNHSRSVERISVRLRDVNGPRGGVDVKCRIKVVLRGLPSVVVENLAATLRPAVSGALASAERTVRRTVQRRRSRVTR